VDHVILPDIQESDESGFPTTAWFKYPQHIIDCIKEEVKLLREYNPDLVLGVFRFTIKASAQIAGLPYDALICGSMLHQSGDVLGYSDFEAGRETQDLYLNNFYRYAAVKMNRALSAFGLEEIDDIRVMLRGRRTFLWDFPEFMSLPPASDTVHIGPLYWDGWPYDDLDMDIIVNSKSPWAILTFGTCTGDISCAKKMVRILQNMGYRIVFAAGGQSIFTTALPSCNGIFSFNFAPVRKIIPHVSLLVSHGGQLTIFEGLQHRIPQLVIPFQPEQSHNGVCLERLGCGLRLIPSCLFSGSSNVYTDAFHQVSDEDIAATITKFVSDSDTGDRLAGIPDLMRNYGGVQTLVPLLEQ
jgi:hypothetical protein